MCWLSQQVSVITFEHWGNPVFVHSGCPFLLLYSISKAFSSLPPLPSTPPSLALSDSVLIEAIKPASSHQGGDINLHQAQEGAAFFPPCSCLLSLGSLHELRDCSSVCGELSNLLLQMPFRGSLPCPPPLASLYPSITHCNWRPLLEDGGKGKNVPSDGNSQLHCPLLLGKLEQGSTTAGSCRLFLVYEILFSPWRSMLAPGCLFFMLCFCD